MFSFDFYGAPITVLLLVLNGLVSLAALFIDQRLLGQLSFRPREILHNKEYYRFVTAGFVHVGILHLVFNMWVLALFGPGMERTIGSLRFLLIYLGAELAAHALTLYKQRDNPQYAAVGASGAISGILFAFCLFQPFALLGVFFVLPMPAWLFAILYVVLSIYAMNREQRQLGGIAHEAHLGGAIGGLVLTILLYPAALSIFLGQVQRVLG